MKVHVPHLKLGHKTRRLVYVGNGATSVDSEYNKTGSADCDRRFVSTIWSGFLLTACRIKMKHIMYFSCRSD